MNPKLSGIATIGLKDLIVIEIKCNSRYQNSPQNSQGTWTQINIYVLHLVRNDMIIPLGPCHGIPIQSLFPWGFYDSSWWWETSIVLLNQAIWLKAQCSRFLLLLPLFITSIGIMSPCHKMLFKEVPVHNVLWYKRYMINKNDFQPKRDTILIIIELYWRKKIRAST